MHNMTRLIKSHNQRITQPRDKGHDPCNCRDKSKCPLSGKCQAKGVIYNAKVTSNTGDISNYIGLTDTTFKTRYNNHVFSFKHRKHQLSTQLSKHIWGIKDKDQPYNINWSIISRASSYSNSTKRCDLCLSEKLEILTADKTKLLNRRSELISKCRHQNKFTLENHQNRPTKRNRPSRPIRPTTHSNVHKLSETHNLKIS